MLSRDISASLQTQEMLNSRDDDLKSGRVVKPIGGEQFFESLRRREDELRLRLDVFGRNLYRHSRLVPFPGQRHGCPDLTSRPLRFILVREYLIAYTSEEKPL